MFRLIVARVTSTSEGCQIELRLIVLAITDRDARTELKCVTWNQAGRQEVVTHLQLEGKTAPSCSYVWWSWWRRKEHARACLSPQTLPSRGWWWVWWRAPASWPWCPCSSVSSSKLKGKRKWIMFWLDRTAPSNSHSSKEICYKSSETQRDQHEWSVYSCHANTPYNCKQ